MSPETPSVPEPEAAPAPDLVPASSPAPVTECRRWSEVEAFPVGFQLNAGWVAADGSAVLLGQRRAILHFERGAWTTRSSGAAQQWSGVWGSEPDDVYAVGADGIHHFDGVAWALAAPGLKVAASGVWGSGPDDVYAVGPKGFIVHYDGEVWLPMDSGVEEDLSLVWGAGPDQVYAAGNDGVMLRSSGKDWSKVRMPTKASFTGLSGTSATNLFATTSERVFRYDGVEWSPTLHTREGEQFVGVIAVGPGDVSVFLDSTYAEEHPSGIDVWHFDGIRWSPREFTDEWITGGATSPLDYTYFLGERGEIHRHDRDGEVRLTRRPPARWARHHEIAEIRVGITFSGRLWVGRGDDWAEVPPLERHRWEDAWIDDDGVLMAVGIEKGYLIEWPVVAEFRADEWSVKWRGEPGSVAGMNAVRPLGGDDFVAVGNDGLIVQRSRGVWSVVPSGTKASLKAVWASGPRDAYMVGARHDEAHGGVLLHYDGDRWSSVPIEVDPLMDVWGNGPDDVFVAGGARIGFYMDEGTSQAVILHYDGKTWSESLRQNDASGEIFEAIMGNSGRDVFAVRSMVYGDGGYDYSTWKVFHHDGSTWSEKTAGYGAFTMLSVTPSELGVTAGSEHLRYPCLEL